MFAHGKKPAVRIHPLVCVFLSLFLFFGGVEAHAGKAEQIPSSLGKVIFLSAERLEILFEKKDSGILLLSEGLTVHIPAGGKNIHFRITDVEGKYLRCTIYEEAKSLFSEIKEGSAVFNSRDINSRMKYYDAKILLSSMIRLYEKFIYDVESADDPALLARHVVKFTGELDLLIPEIVRITKVYPEFSRGLKSVPHEIKSEAAVLRRLEARLGDVFYKIRSHSGNEAVSDAAMGLQKVLQKLKKRN